MAKFVIDTLDGNWVKFKCEYAPDPKKPNEIHHVLYFSMYKHKWEKAGRPVELLITIEGVTA